MCVCVCVHVLKCACTVVQCGLKHGADLELEHRIEESILVNIFGSFTKISKLDLIWLLI